MRLIIFFADIAFVFNVNAAKFKIVFHVNFEKNIKVFVEAKPMH